MQSLPPFSAIRRRLLLLLCAVLLTQLPAAALWLSGLRPTVEIGTAYGCASAIALAGLFGMALACWTRTDRIVELVRDCVRHVQRTEPTARPDQGSVETVQASIDSLEAAVRSLEQDATRDPLTGAYNRRCCTARLDADLARAARDGTPFSIAIFDLDGLKEINDQYGHASGDVALRHLAAVLQESVREGDWVARWGGDEFLVALWDADEASATGAVERMRRRLAERPVELGGEPVTLAACAGTAQAAKDETSTGLFERADALLLELKRKRRGPQAV